MEKYDKTRVIGVCSANVVRSPIFEAVMNDYTNSNNIKNIDIKSAGVDVDDIEDNNVSLEKAVKIIDAALHHGLVPGWEKSFVEPIIKDYEDLIQNPGSIRIGEKDIFREIREDYGKFRPLVHGYLIRCRNQALEEARITFLPSHLKQFDIILDPAHFYIAMSKQEEMELLNSIGHYKNSYSLKGMYEDKQKRIKTYGSLVDGENIEDDLKAGISGARRIVQYFMDTREKAIRTIIGLE